MNFFTVNNIQLNDEWFVNLTNLNVPIEVKWLLSLGKQFAVPNRIKNIDLFQLIADVESILDTVEDQKTRDILQAKVCNILHNNTLKIESHQV